MKNATETLLPVGSDALVRPLCVGDRVSFHNGKRRGYGTIYAETPAHKNGMGITVPRQISVSTGNPRHQKIGLDVDYAEVRICRTSAIEHPIR